MVAVEWADGCDNVGLVASVDILSLSLSLSLSLPLESSLHRSHTLVELMV